MPDYKNERPVATPEGLRNPQTVYPIGPGLGKGKFVSAQLNRGMITTIDPLDIPPQALQAARNARLKNDKIERRAGTVKMTPARPNVFSVLETAYHKKKDGTEVLFRFTSTTIHYRGVTWIAVTPTTGTLNGGINDRYQCVTAFDRLFFANNGVDQIQEINTTAFTFSHLGNAPKFRYITSIYNRLVGANLSGATPNPVLLGWSGDANLGEWDPLVDETAGSTPLVDSPSDLADFITGVFGLTNVLLVLRERSLWLATKQPIPTNPFYFYAAQPGLGCDCPSSAVSTPSGVVWMDRRSGSVWAYTPGGAPERIGFPIENELIKSVNTPDQVFASYSPINAKYSLAVQQVGQAYVKVWEYSFKSPGWTYGEYENITSIDDVDLPGATVMIDDLGDVPIDQLTGMIDDLSPVVASIPVRTFGRNDGEIATEDESVFTDPVFAGSLNTTGAYTTEFVSKTFELPTDDGYFAEIRIDFVSAVPTTLLLYYSKDGGVSWNSVGKQKVMAATKIGKPDTIKLVKNIKAKRFAWKLVSTAGQFSVINYEVHVFKGGDSRI